MSNGPLPLVYDSAFFLQGFLRYKRILETSWVPAYMQNFRKTQEAIVRNVRQTASN